MTAFATVLYGANGTASTSPGVLVTIDQTNADGTVIGDPAPPGGLTGLTFGPGGALFATTARASSLITIDPSSGALISNIGSMGISIGDLAYNPVSGLLYGIRSNSDFTGNGGELYTINPTTAAITLVGQTPETRGGGIGFTDDGRLFFASGALYELDPTSATAISTTAFSQSAFFDGLAIRPDDGQLFGTQGSSDDQLYTISYAGQVLLLGNTGTGSPSDLAFSQVPEPATLALLGIALAGLGFSRRNRTVN